MNRTLAGFILVALAACAGGVGIGYNLNQPVVTYQVIPEADHTLCNQRTTALEHQVDVLLAIQNYNRLENNKLSLRYAQLEQENGILGFKVSAYKHMTGEEIVVWSEVKK